MIRLTEEQFGDLKRRENPEVFTEEQISNWIIDVAEKLTKADLGEADPIEKAEADEFNEEFKQFTRIQIIKAPKSEDLTKSLQYETLYIRERQIEFFDEIQKGEDGEPLKGDDGEIIKARGGVYTDTAYNRKKGRVGQKYGGVHSGVNRDMSEAGSKATKNIKESGKKGLEKFTKVPVKGGYILKFGDYYWNGSQEVTSKDSAKIYKESADEGDGEGKSKSGHVTKDDVKGTSLSGRKDGGYTLNVTLKNGNVKHFTLSKEEVASLKNSPVQKPGIDKNRGMFDMAVEKLNG